MHSPAQFPDITTPLHILHFFLIVAAVCSTIFPIAYARGGQWYKSTLGRVLMLHGVALALALDLSTLFTYWRTTDYRLRIWIDIGVIALVAFATLALLYILVNTQYNKHVSPPKRREYDGTMVVEQRGDKKVFTLSVDSPLDDLDQKEEVTFRVTARKDASTSA